MEKMIITRLLLVEYIRMATAGIRRFQYEPGEEYKLQLILGTNGSGKSSLIHVLWALPANVDDFGPGGRFEIDIQYKGHTYTVISNFEGKAHHSFLIDGEEHNLDGKINMCYALCEEHLGVTNEIRNLALGKELLTNMSPARRRYWLVKLADTDFTYAMGVYKKLQEAHRDAQGAIKRLGKRLVDERNKLTPPSVVEKINSEYREIRELITEIYGMRNSEAPKSGEVMTRLQSTETQMERFGNEIDRLSVDAILASGYKSREDMETAQGVFKIEVAAGQSSLQFMYSEHTRIKRKYDLLVKAGNESLGELNDRKQKSLEVIAYEETFICYKGVKPFGESASWLQAKNTFDDIYFDLYEKTSVLKVNDGDWTTEKLEMAEGRIAFDRPALNALQGRISRLNADIEHRKNHVQQDTSTCPKCKYSWSSKASESDLEKAELLLKELTDEAEKLQARLDEFMTYVKEFNEYRNAYKEIINIWRGASIMVSYFQELTKNNRLMTHPGTVAMDLAVVQKDLFHGTEIERHQEIIRAIDEQIELKKNLETDTLEVLESDLNMWEERTGKLSARLNELNIELKTIESLIDQDTRITKLNSSLLDAYDNQVWNVKDYVKSRYQEALMELILSLQTQLARKEDVLSQITTQEATVAEIEHQLNEAVMNERVAKAMHQALSPTSGAIAEGLHRFVNVFLGKMNRIVASIWTYSLKLQPFNMEEGSADLDYKFPYLAEGKEKPNKDVVEGSESMIDVFNFAFRFCALNQLGLGHLPLFLDEFESAFDDAHRERAIYFIKKLIDENACGQIFAISHYESNHGALRSLAQTCVLSRDNLLLSSDGNYNEHVVIN